MRTASFDRAVERFLQTLITGDSIEAAWESLAETEGLHPADLQRALQRAEDLEAEEDGDDWG
jgi:hypothetical protein